MATAGNLRRLEEVEAEARACTACPLAGGRTQVVFSRGDPASDLMFIGEAPGQDEDREGEPFVGRSGKLLDRLLSEELGRRRTECYVCNVVKCHPPANRDPKPDEVATCRHFLDSQVALIQPKVIVTLGNFASRALLDTKDPISRLRGCSYPFAGATLVPTYHPAAALRGGGTVLAEMRADFVRAKRALSPDNP
jgi:uracil-DNA glycosylase family 4